MTRHDYAPGICLGILILVLLALMATACTKTPTGPSRLTEGGVGAHAPSALEADLAEDRAEPINGLPVDLGPLGIEDIGYVCATKPRRYFSEFTGEWQDVTDHYVQRGECPAELID